MTRRLLIVLCTLLLTGQAAVAAEESTLTLDDCLRQLQQSRLLQAAEYGVRQAMAGESQAKSNYLPHIDAQAAYTLQAEPQQVLIGGGQSPTQDRNYASLHLQAEQLLYDFGRSASSLAAAGSTRQAAEFDQEALRQDLVVQTIAAYYRILSAEELLEVADQEVELDRSHLAIANALYEQGAVTRNDPLQAEVRLAASVQQQTLRAGELDKAWLQLNYLLGRDPQQRNRLQSGSQKVPQEEPAMDDPPELQAQQARMETADAGLRQTRGDYWPRLTARLAADYVENSHVEEQVIYSAGVVLTFNLFSGGATQARVYEAQSALNRQRLLWEDMQQRSAVNLSAARSDMEVARRQIDVADAAIRQAEENLKINRDRYREQVGTATEVLDAQTLLTQTRTDRAQAIYQYQTAAARVMRAAGQL